MVIHLYAERLRKECDRYRITPECRELVASYAIRLLDDHLPVIFDAEHLSKLIGVSSPDLLRKYGNTVHAHYRAFHLSKGHGKVRNIVAPDDTLKEIQRWLHTEVFAKLTPHEAASGFVRRRSTGYGARRHRGRPLVINLDLKDFFPSIRSWRVFGLLRELGYTEEVSWLVTNLCCLDRKLPQGAPTSPVIANLIAKRLDARLDGLAKKHKGVHYTRYADDITFSGPVGFAGQVKLIRRIIEDEGFTVNESKTRFLRAHERQEVTGLVVNAVPGVNSASSLKPRVPRALRRRIRQDLHYLEKYGAQDCFARDDIKQRFPEHVFAETVGQYLNGQIAYVKAYHPELAEELWSKWRAVFQSDAER